MKKWRNNLERGQVLVILVAGLVALLGFTAVSVDMGQYYSDRRYDQNAADDSALAGASRAGEVMAGKISVNNFSCENTTVVTAMSAAVAAAQSRATTNHFTIADNLDTKHGVSVSCDPTNKRLKIDVMISSDVETSFAHFVFSNVLHNTVEAVTIIEPGTGLGEGMAIVALEDATCNPSAASQPLHFTGNSGTTIHGSGAHSNSCLVCGGNVIIEADHPLELLQNMNTGCEAYVGTAGVQVTDNYISPHTMTAKCDPNVQNKVKVQASQTETLSGGTYQEITTLGGSTLIMHPGLYCIEGKLDIGGGTWKVDGNMDDGITLYVKGNVTINGGEVQIRAPLSAGWTTEPASYSYPYPTLPGMLLYVDSPSGASSVKINGNSSNDYFRGSINYPYGDITLNGNAANVQWLVEVIGNTVKINGNAATDITYNGNNGFPGFPYISFQK